MSRAWDGTEGLIGLVGNMSLGNGKMGGGAGRNFYPQGPGMLPITTTNGGANLGLDVGDGAAYMAAGMAQYAGAAGVAGLLPQGYHNGYQPQGYHPAFHPGLAGYSNGAEVPNGGGSNGYIPMNGTVDGYGMPGPNNMGWGGQTIQDASGFKAPWFGRSRGRGPTANGNGGNGNGHSNGRGRHRNGRNGNGGRNGNANGRGRRSWGDAHDDALGDDVTVEALVSLVAGVPEGQPIGDSTYKALFQLEGRSCALLLKELARASLHRRAGELFDWVRALEPGHPLQSLLDVYSYTAAISLCISTHDVDRALSLANEMKAHGIERNVHTYTALMNVCIKCSKHAMALETYKLMRADGCVPNVVTYNTLIDVHGKMGAWEEAVAVLGTMKAEGVEPVLRTYNTLLIACNMCSQPREAVAVYRRMIEEVRSRKVDFV